MIAGEPRHIDLSEGPAALAAVSDTPAVFLVWPAEGAPYLARTWLLRRRLSRLFAERSRPSRLLSLAGVATRVEYWPCGSRLDTALTFYALARRHFPQTYTKLVKLRPAVFVRVLLSNEFPRTLVTTRLSGTSLCYGPFRTRASAELFESQLLDLFQIRRCQEDLVPSPDHPGCMYGEMAMCLRPCQQVVSASEYASEVRRALEFLNSQGRSLLATAERARDQFSRDLLFEEAAREHKRLDKIQQVLKLRDELAAPLDKLHGVAVTASPEPETVELRFLIGGWWQPPVRFSLRVTGSKPVPMDQRLREIVSSLPGPGGSGNRAEHVALLARWYYSSWRDGDWIPFEETQSVPYRRLVAAVHRMARGKPSGPV